MVGFVGAQARKRRRNRIFLIILIVFVSILVFYLPSIDFTIENKELPSVILPDKVDDKTSLISEIEELKLAVFQKDQRIKFRDKQINDLRTEVQNIKNSYASLEIEYNKTVGSFSELKNNLSENSSENINEMKKLKDKIKELNNLIKNYKEQITKLTNELSNSITDEDLQKINIENSILKNEIKLNNEKYLEAESVLRELKSLLEEKQKEIDKLLYLKDLGHHG